LDETPPAASLYATLISSMLENKQKFHISMQKILNKCQSDTFFLNK
jgi:hypothetical protein